MKAIYFAFHFSGLLLVLSGQATAHAGKKLEVSQIQKITDASQGGYRPFMEFTVAGQIMTGLLDTGSGDLNFPRTGSDFCQSEGQQCDGSNTGFKAGSLDFGNKTSRVKDINIPLNATFTGGAAFLGRFVEGPLQVTPGGKTLTVQMGLVESGGVPPGDVSFPIIGLGPVDGESAEKVYPNVPARMKRDNFIKTNAYGLYLGDFRSPDNGTLVWGGFDAAKFEGKLKAAPLVETSDGIFPLFGVDFSSVGLAPSKNGGKPNNGRSNGTECRDEEKSSLPGHDDGVSLSAEFPRSVFSNHRRLYKSKRAPFVYSTKRLSTRDLLRRKQRGNLLTNETPPVVWLDTGVPEIVLPLGTIEALGERLGAQPGPNGEFLADCRRIRGVDLTIGLNEERIHMRVPLDSIMVAPGLGRGAGDAANNGTGNPVQSGNGTKFGGGRGGGAERGQNGGSNRNDDGQNGNRGNRGNGDSSRTGKAGTCQLALAPVLGNEPTDIPILGAPAMQHMYIVFDMDSRVLMMAQAKMNETKTDVREYVPAGRA